MNSVIECLNMMEKMGLPHWYIGTVITILIIFIVLALFWGKLQPFFDWLILKCKEIRIGKRRLSIWDGVERMEKKINKMEINLEKMLEMILKHDKQIDAITNDLSRYQDRLDAYPKAELDKMEVLEFELDSYFFSEFWRRVEQLGEDNFHTDPVNEIYQRLRKDTLSLWEKRKNEMQVPFDVAKVSEQADAMTNDYAQPLYEKFLILYEDRSIKPRFKVLKNYLDLVEVKYKTFWESSFRTLIKVALHG